MGTVSRGGKGRYLQGPVNCSDLEMRIIEMRIPFLKVTTFGNSECSVVDVENLTENFKKMKVWDD